MKFLADECCDTAMILHLREEGHDVVSIQEEAPGIPDSEILLDAYNQKRILITEDKDFGELVYRLKKPAFGVILLRFHPLEKELKTARLCELAEKYKDKLKGNFLVVGPDKIRIKKLQI
jgi:predicted nuclease of predicted toxin-antitoxin system